MMHRQAYMLRRYEFPIVEAFWVVSFHLISFPAIFLLAWLIWRSERIFIAWVEPITYMPRCFSGSRQEY